MAERQEGRRRLVEHQPVAEEAEAEANTCSEREELQAEEGSLATLGWITGSEALEFRGVAAVADVEGVVVGVVDGVAFV